MLELGDRIVYGDCVGDLRIPDITMSGLADYLTGTLIGALRTSLASPLLWRYLITLDDSLRELHRARHESLLLDLGDRVAGSDSAGLKAGAIVISAQWVGPVQFSNLKRYAHHMVARRLTHPLAMQYRAFVGILEEHLRAR